MAAISDPNELRQIAENGGRFYYDKTNNSYIVKFRGGRRYVSKKLNDSAFIYWQMQRMKENERNMKEDSVLKENAKLIEYLYSATKDPNKPILAKEIETSAWFHNLIHDLGTFTYHFLASRVEWTVEDIKDEKKALKKLCERLINLYKNEKEIKRVEELKMDAEILEMYLSFCMDLLEETAQRSLSLHEAHKKFVELVAKVACTDCKKNLMVNTVLSNWTLRETSQKVGDEKLVELVVERYAKKRGLDEETKKKYLSALVARDEFEKFSRRLANVADMLERAPRSVQDVVADTASLLNSALADNDFASEMRNVRKCIAELKAIDYFFREGKNEDEAVKELKITLESIKAKLEEIEAGKKNKELEALKEELRTMIDNLTARIDALESKISSVLQPQNNKPENIISEAKKIVDTAKQILQEMGYKVEPASVPLHELNKILEQKKKKEIIDSLNPEELKNLLESKGYKVVGGPVKWEDVEKMIEDAKKKAYEEALEDKKIEMAADVLRDVTSRFIDLFKPAVQYLIESQTKKEEVTQNLSESLCKNEVEEV